MTLKSVPKLKMLTISFWAFMLMGLNQGMLFAADAEEYEQQETTCCCSKRKAEAKEDTRLRKSDDFEGLNRCSLTLWMWEMQCLQCLRTLSCGMIGNSPCCLCDD